MPRQKTREELLDRIDELEAENEAGRERFIRRGRGVDQVQQGKLRN